MQKIKNIQEVSEVVNQNDMTIIYFTGKACSACEVIKYKLERIVADYPFIASREIDGEVHLDIAARYQVFTLPHMILFVQGKETIRTGKHVDLMELEKKISRYYELLGLGEREGENE